MPPRQPVDPARLEGEALDRWYRRTPEEVQSERQAAQEQHYQSFFGRPELASNEAASGLMPAVADGSDSLWISNGRGGYRRVGTSKMGDLLSGHDDSGDRPSSLPDHAAAPEIFELQEVGNPHNPRLRREWEAANGRAWPRTADGRAYEVAHIRAIADGGSNTLDNIRPMDPLAHRESHKEDRSRWAKRSHIARAFGGKVEPPLHAPRRSRGPTVRGFGLLGLIPNLTGILSGRIRTDSQEHFYNDLLGYSSEDDFPKGGLTA